MGDSLSSNPPQNDSKPRPPHWTFCLRLIALLIIPISALVLTSEIQHALGPSWVGSTHPSHPDRPPVYDPDYTYLLNSINIAEGASPGQTEHPGTPIEVIGSAVLEVRHALSGATGSLRTEVLADPEGALNPIRIVLESIFLLSLTIFGFAARRLTGSMLCALTAQCLPVMSIATLVSLNRVMPEPMLLSVSLLLGAVMLLVLSQTRPLRTRTAALLGVLVAVGLTSKVTFLPVALLPWAILGVFRGWTKQQAAARLAHFAGLLVGIFVCLLPILSQLPKMFNWLWKVFVGGGRYGSTKGGHTVINPDRYLSDLGQMIIAEPVLAATMFAGVATLISLPLLNRLVKKEGPRPDRRQTWTLAAVVAAQALQLLIVAKHPGARYLMPSIGLSGLGWCLICTLARSMCAGLPRPVVTWRTVCSAGTLSLLCGAVVIGLRFRWELTWMRPDSAAHMDLARATEEAAQDGSIVVYTYRSSSIPFALALANTYAKGRYSADLAAMFPKRLFYVVAVGKFWPIDGVGDDRDRIPDSQISAWAKEGRLLFQCPPKSRPRALEYEELVPARGAAPEGLYRARLPNR